MNKRYVLLGFLVALLGINTSFATSAGQLQISNKLALNQELSLNMELKQQLTDLEQQYNVTFLYKTSLVDGRLSSAKVSLEGSLREQLKNILNPQNLEFKYLEDRTFVIRPKENSTTGPTLADTVSGQVTDDTGQPLPNVNVLVKGTTRGTATDVDGNYRLVVPSLSDTLLFSFEKKL